MKCLLASLPTLLGTPTPHPGSRPHAKIPAKSRGYAASRVLMMQQLMCRLKLCNRCHCNPHAIT
jgi:hypothetical protein